MNLPLLKQRMTDLGISPAQLIRQSGVSESTIKRIMRGKTDVHSSTLRMIAAAVDLNPSALIDDDAEPPTAFDPSNVPEISAQVLEEMTEMEQNDPHGGHMTGHFMENEPPHETVSVECEIFYERMIKYLRERLDAAYSANEQIRLQNTELVKANARLIEQEAATRSRNRALYTAIIIACIAAGLCLAGLVAYFVYDIMTPAWGAVRY